MAARKTRTRIPFNPDRLWSRILIASDDECWEWQGCRERQGYGRIWYGDGGVLTHRLAYILTNGEPPDDAPHILHRCDNPPCCNPAHLYAGTNAQNVADKMQRGRFKPNLGERHGNSKLTTDSVLSIRERFRGGESRDVLAAEYGIAPAYVNQLAARRAWRHV